MHRDLASFIAAGLGLMRSASSTTRSSYFTLAIKVHAHVPEIGRTYRRRLAA